MANRGNRANPIPVGIPGVRLQELPSTAQECVDSSGAPPGFPETILGSATTVEIGGTANLVFYQFAASAELDTRLRQLCCVSSCPFSIRTFADAVAQSTAEAQLASRPHRALGGLVCRHNLGRDPVEIVAILVRRHLLSLLLSLRATVDDLGTRRCCAGCREPWRESAPPGLRFVGCLSLPAFRDGSCSNCVLRGSTCQRRPVSVISLDDDE